MFDSGLALSGGLLSIEVGRPIMPLALLKVFRTNRLGAKAVDEPTCPPDDRRVIG
jgi:hypothetical protein